MPWPGVALLFYAHWPATVGECCLEFFSVMLQLFCPIPLCGECGACLITDISLALTLFILSLMLFVFRWFTWVRCQSPVWENFSDAQRRQVCSFFLVFSAPAPFVLVFLLSLLSQE